MATVEVETKACGMLRRCDTTTPGANAHHGWIWVNKRNLETTSEIGNWKVQAPEKNITFLSQRLVLSCNPSKSAHMPSISADPCRQQGGACQRRGQQTRLLRPAIRSLDLRHGPWTRADGRKKLVSRQVRKRRLAVWAAGRGPDPSFAAMVFWCCDRVLSPQLCRTKASCKRTRASWQLAV